MPFPSTTVRGRMLPASAWQTLAALRPVQYFHRLYAEDRLWLRLADGTLSQAALQADMATVQTYGFNAVRVFAHASANAFPIGPGTTITAAQKAALVTLLQAANALGLKVWLNLFHFYQGYILTDSLAWLTQLAGALPPSLLSTLACVEVQNELGRSTTGLLVPNAQGQGWLRAMIPACRAAFPGVPLTASFHGNFGLVSGDVTGTTDVQWILQAVGNPAALDFYAYHPYVGGAPENAYAVIGNLRAQLGAVPLYIGEYGLATMRGSASFNAGTHPSSIAGNEAEAEFFTRHMVNIARAYGMPGPLPWEFYDYPGVPDPASLAAASVSGTGSAFLQTDALGYRVAWTNGQGHTAVAAATGAVPAFGGAGQNVVIPALSVPFGATGFQLYLPVSSGSGAYALWSGTGGTQTGLLGDGVQATTAVTVTGWPTGAAAPGGANNTGPDGVSVSATSGGYGYGLLRTADEPLGAGPKAAATTLQSLFVSGAALSQAFNGDFEVPAIADFAGVVQWPAYWRYTASGTATLTYAVLTSQQHGGAACLSVSAMNNASGSAQTPILFTIPFVGNPVDPARSYTLSAYVNCTSFPAGATFVVGLDWFRADGGTAPLTSTNLTISATTSGYQLFTVNTAPPRGAAYYRLNIKVVIPNGTVSTGQFYVDDITVSVA